MTAGQNTILKFGIRKLSGSLLKTFDDIYPDWVNVYMKACGAFVNVNGGSVPNVVPQ